ncbi:GNAT family N-acetyltransferase [Alkalihalobacillus sp. CinArs1]|uniref:GNAT family N-acetyltransferase n=1 Tax=Alkalihalobacillus sp. CinArs1 TaxID=2995314 RepID=UPI0022DDB858|nr:GNAT family N-acetyltransferase [Alkalihalobacillus sp. CinArs1]
MTNLVFYQNASMVERSEIDMLVDRLTIMKEREGNPMGVEIKEFGDAVAFSVKNIPGPSFNTIKGVSDNNVEDIDAMLDFYTCRGIPARFEITPIQPTTEFLRALSNKGYFQCGFHTSLYRTFDIGRSPNDEQQPSLHIQEMSKDDFSLFGEIYTKGFGMPPFIKEHVTENNKILLNNGKWTFYLASVKGEPAGVGALFVHNGVGILAASTTVPGLRNKGVQTALIKTRLEKASELNCSFIVGQAAYGMSATKIWNEQG